MLADTLNPVFNETFITLGSKSLKGYTINVYDYDNLSKTLLGSISLPNQRSLKGSFEVAKGATLTLQSNVVPLAAVLAAASATQNFIHVELPAITSGRGWATKVTSISVGNSASFVLTIKLDCAPIGRFEQTVVSGLMTSIIEFTPPTLIAVGTELVFEATLFSSSGVKLSHNTAFGVIGGGISVFKTPEEDNQYVKKLMRYEDAILAARQAEQLRLENEIIAEQAAIEKGLIHAC